MARRVTRRMYPLPTRHDRQVSVSGQLSKPAADVDGTPREEPRKRRHQSAADARVRRRVLLATIQIGMLQHMSINWHVPTLGQVGQCAHVIEVPMRQNNGIGAASVSEST